MNFKLSLRFFNFLKKFIPNIVNWTNRAERKSFLLRIWSLARELTSGTELKTIKQVLNENPQLMAKFIDTVREMEKQTYENVQRARERDIITNQISGGKNYILNILIFFVFLAMFICLGAIIRISYINSHRTNYYLIIAFFCFISAIKDILFFYFGSRKFRHASLLFLQENINDKETKLPKVFEKNTEK